MPLSDIVNVQITKQTTGISQVGFGTPMILSTEAAVDAKFAETAKVYGSIQELQSTGDDYDLDGVTYQKALALFSQNPKVDQLVIGKRATSPLMTLTITPVAVNSTLYRITISGAHTAASFSGSTEFDYTSDATATVAEITAGLTAAIVQTAWAPTTAYAVGDYVSNGNRVYICTVAGTSDGSGGPTGTGSAITDATVTWAHKGPTQDVDATDNTTDITLEKAASPGGAGTAGIPFRAEINDRSLLTSQNVTADPGLTADLAAVRGNTDGNDDWYAVILDSYGKAEIEGLAADIEATGTPGKLFLASTSDEDCLGASTTDVMSNLQTSAYVRTSIMWHEDPQSGPEAAWGGACLPYDPGEITWNLFTLAGVAVSTLTTSEITNIEGKSGNYYLRISGRNVTQTGITSGGDYIDTTRGIDFIAARLAERVFARLSAALKVPFTDPGIAVIEAEVRGVLLLGVAQSIFTNDPAPTVTVPRANSVAVNDRANRLLPDVDWTAQLAGAIHTVEISGTVTV